MHVRLLGGRCVAFAGEAGLACALADVAEGFIKGGVGAFGGVGEDARDDLLGFGGEGFVGGVALRDGLAELGFEIIYALAGSAGGGGDGRELRVGHPAEGLGGRERVPSVQHSLHLCFVIFRTGRHGKESFPCLLRKHV